MRVTSKIQYFLVFLGDIIVFLLSLWLMLVIRYHQVPVTGVFFDYLHPFSILFFVWVVVFFISGLYEKQALFFKNKLQATLLNVQTINVIITVLFFYFIPYFGITPKTNLFLYLVISSILLLIWRMYGLALFGFRKRQPAVLIGSGKEMIELYDEVNTNRYYLNFVSMVDLDKNPKIDLKAHILKHLNEQGAGILVIDLKDEKIGTVLPQLYDLIFSGVRFVDIHKVYEDIFDRIPLSLIKHSWFLENISVAPKIGYDFFKRLMDIVISLFAGIVSLVFYPFVYLAIKVEDGGPMFVTQKRVGKRDKTINLYKFRSMSFNDEGNQQQIGQNKVTKVGKFIRKTRIDELPQFWNILKGDISFIGPRPELPALVAGYEKEIMHYKTRHLIKPGLSGWAQLYHKNPPKVTANNSETRNKLSYDLYYIKNRSLLLDFIITLKTIGVFFSRSGV